MPSSSPLVACPGYYRHHLQGIATDGVDVFWSFTSALVKTTLDGRLLNKIPVATHHGDLCWHDGKVYVAVNLGRFNQEPGQACNWIFVYDDTSFDFLEKYHVPEVVHGAGGMDWHDGAFQVIGGLPVGYQENYVYSYSPAFAFQKRHVIPSGYTKLGIQTACHAHDRWWFGCYGDPEVTLQTDNRFNLLAIHHVSTSVGIIGLPDGSFRTGRTAKTPDGYTGAIHPASIHDFQ